MVLRVLCAVASLWASAAGVIRPRCGVGGVASGARGRVWFWVCWLVIRLRCGAAGVALRCSVVKLCGARCSVRGRGARVMWAEW